MTGVGGNRPRPPVAFVDESYNYQKNGFGQPLYVLAAVLIDADRLEQTRAGARRIVAPSRQFHCNELNASGCVDRVHSMLEYVREEANGSVVAIQMPFEGETKAARRHCFEVLQRELSSRWVYFVVPDSRPQPRAADRLVLDKQDEQVARQLRRNRGVHRYLTLTHKRPMQENLLWLPDAVAWATRRDVAAEDRQHFDLIRGVTTLLIVDRYGRRVR